MHFCSFLIIFGKQPCSTNPPLAFAHQGKCVICMSFALFDLPVSSGFHICCIGPCFSLYHMAVNDQRCYIWLWDFSWEKQYGIERNSHYRNSPPESNCSPASLLSLRKPCSTFSVWQMLTHTHNSIFGMTSIGIMHYPASYPNPAIPTNHNPIWPIPIPTSILKLS